jgi:hypothetical protein
MAERRNLLLGLLGWAGFGVLVAVGCELGSRLDDLFFERVPLTANPTFGGLFMQHESGFRVGRPGSSWKKVRVNNLGMRGPDVPEERSPGCQRWLFIGASETFGEPFVADQEFPARLRAKLAGGPCVEILNAAFPGIVPRQFNSYYRAELARHRADVVFIYPSTHFYLKDELPPPAPEPGLVAESGGLALDERSRFLGRLRDSAEVPAFIQRHRVQKWIDRQVAQRPPGWQFTGAPADRLDILDSEFREFLKTIQDSGAEAVLMTHAIRATNPPRPEDFGDLRAMRVYVPRPTEAGLADFEYAAADRIREIGRATGTRVIDIAAPMSGHRKWFIDLVHFTPEGHERIADMIVAAMREPPPREER